MAQTPINIPPELIQTMSAMMASALQASAANMGSDGGGTGSTTAVQSRVPPFVIAVYQSSENTSMADYFSRFEWALELSKISANQYANYARVYMGSELNNALKFLISPRSSEDLSYEELKTMLISHFDKAKTSMQKASDFDTSRKRRKKRSQTSLFA